MSTVTEIGTYVERVRDALADLPPDDREELLADLHDHLLEVAGEDGDASLEALLGQPESYAAELRSSAGLPPVGAPDRGSRSGAGWRQLAAHPAARSTMDFLVELRPGWWVARGLLVGVLAGAAAGSVPAGVLVALLAVPASVWVGRHSRRWLTIAASAAVALVALLAVSVAGATTNPPQDYPPVYDSGLRGVTNIHPYSSDGKPLRDVLLYDQDGRPVVLPGDAVTPEGDQVTSVPRYGTDGRVIGNVYPREQTRQDSTYLLTDDGPTARRVTPPAVSPPSLEPR